MNDNLDPTNDDLAETLHQQFRLSTPTGVKADLLYRCGVAAGESKSSKRRTKNSWITAAVVILAFGVGGLGGRFTYQPVGQDKFAKSSDTENTINNDLNSPELNWPAIESQRPSFNRPKNALTAGMDFNQARRALSQMQPPIGISSNGPETSPRPLSVWMSNGDLEQLLSL